MQRTMIFAAAVLAFGAIAADTPQDAAAGHCNYTMKNEFAGPLKVCLAPATAAQCGETGKADENSAAVWAEGACPIAGAVGSCRRDSDATTYYEGEASGLEIGCGFQGGTWSPAAQ